MSDDRNVLDEYGLSSVMVEAVTGGADSALTKIHETLVAISTKVDAATKAEQAKATGEGTRRADPLEAKYGNDEQGKTEAMSFLRESVFQSVIDYADEDPGRTFHVLNGLLEGLVTYLRAECAHFRMTETPKTVGTSERAQLRSDYNTVRGVLDAVAKIALATKPEFRHSSFEVVNGQPKSVLPGFRGASGQSHGKFAKVYKLSWTIDDESIEAGTPLAEIVRYLWHGTDRIGKSAKDLSDLLDSQVPEWTKPEPFVKTITVNDHEVTVSRTDEDEDEDEEQTEE